MSDLCAPVYVVMGGDEEMTFWCFVQIMERMVRTILPSFVGHINSVYDRNAISCEIRAA